MFFKTKFTDVLFLGSKSNNVRVIKYIFTTISILTYLYSIYNCIETSLKLNKTINNIFNKMTTVIETLNNMFKINYDTYTLLKKNSSNLNISIVTKKKLGNALKRNFCKRRFKSLVNEAVKELSLNFNYSYLILVKDNSLRKDCFEDLKKAMFAEFNKII